MTNALLKQDVRTLIHSHLFCVDNLSDADIRNHLTEDGNPVGYEGQHILGYHWFAYPNAVEGLYSKVFARVNMFGDFVVGLARRPVSLLEVVKRYIAVGVCQGSALVSLYKL